MAYVQVVVMALEVIRVFNHWAEKNSTMYSHLTLPPKDGKPSNGFESYRD
jgi:hypothetical protein